MSKRPARKTTAVSGKIGESISTDTSTPTVPFQGRGGRIMYFECKAGALEGDARIARVTFSKSGRTIYYRGQRFQSLKGAGFKSNYFDVDSGDAYWISGPKRNGRDGLYGGSKVPIEEDARQEYWTTIRKQPARADEEFT